MSTYSHPTVQKSRMSDERLRTSRLLCVLAVAALLLGREAFAQSSLNYELYAKAICKSPLISSSGIAQVVLGYQYVLK